MTDKNQYWFLQKNFKINRECNKINKGLQQEINLQYNSSMTTSKVGISRDNETESF